MRRSVLLIAVAFIGIMTSVANAQNASATTNSDRKVSSRVSPSYPELAKRMSVSGKVKIEVIIAPDGHVKSTRAMLGGNPVLVDAAIDAVGKWKFEPGQSETTEVVQLAFESQ